MPSFGIGLADSHYERESSASRAHGSGWVRLFCGHKVLQSWVEVTCGRTQSALPKRKPARQRALLIRHARRPLPSPMPHHSAVSGTATAETTQPKTITMIR